MSLPGNTNRRQPARSVRSTAHRPSNYYAKPFSFRNAAAAPIDNEPPTPIPPGFFPAVSFFTDAVTALPKEMQRHFTILKETEGKLYQPDQDVSELASSINKLPEASRVPLLQHAQSYMQLSLAASISGSATASVANGTTPRVPQSIGDSVLSTEQFSARDPNLAQREELFQQLIGRLRAMATVLDEKNMILMAANETLARQLFRFDSAMPHVETEISEDARLGSNSHWALPHMKDMRRPNGTGLTDRGRRDVTNVNNLAAAAAVVHEGEIAATRSEARREAMLAKRGRARDLDSDLDDRPGAKKHVTTSKVRKAGDIVLDSKPGQGGQAQKRRKIEKNAVAERSMASNANGRNGNGRGSPRGSPAPDARSKKARATVAPSVTRKKTIPNPPSAASSPTRGAFPITTARVSSPARQPTSKPRQQPIHSLVQDSARGRRPSSASSTRKNGNSVETSTSRHGKPGHDDNAPEDASVRAEGTGDQSPTRSAQQAGGRRRESIVKSERPEGVSIRQLPKMEEGPTSTAGRHSRAASRSSKPATPISAAFGEAVPLMRSRSTRNGTKESNGAPSPTVAPSSPKRPHKKGGNGTVILAPGSLGTSEEPEERRPTRRASTIKNSGDGATDTPGEEVDDEDEPRYCTCNRVSFGEMIACDNDRCPTEWFHLECVDLTKVPKKDTKWFCSERCRREARSAGSA